MAVVNRRQRRPPQRSDQRGPHRATRATGRTLPHTPSEVVEARACLTAFVERQADETAIGVGFGWRPDSSAPNTYGALQQAFDRSMARDEDLPISDLYCDSTVYLDPQANICFRFWHDVTHVRRGLSFDLDDELELALWHLSELERAGHGPTTLPWRLLHADLVGQVHVMALCGRFPLDQWRFVLNCLEMGFDAGVLAEFRRPTPPMAVGQ